MHKDPLHQKCKNLKSDGPKGGGEIFCMLMFPCIRLVCIYPNNFVKIPGKIGKIGVFLEK